MIYTDSFEKRIEEYKKELMKYAKNNGTVYSTNSSGFQELESYNKEPKAEKVYKEIYVNNRPMPPEFSGDEESDKEDNDKENNDKENNELLDYDSFLKNNQKSGKLRVQTYASTQVFPIQNAKVTVEKDFSDGSFTFAEEYTDIDGVAENINLPTKSKELSQSPDTPIPYSTYTVKVSHPQFESITFFNVPIFEGIESLQPVAMLPLRNTNQNETFIEEESDL